MTGRFFDRLTPGEPSRVVSERPLSPAARAALRPFFANTKGCSFCTFRYQPYTTDSQPATVERVVRQITALHRRYGITEFSLQSEMPFRILEPLVDRIRREGVPVRSLLLRTFPAILARSPERVVDAIGAAVDAGIRIHLQQLGFESFVATELDHLGKGLTVEENLAAARLLLDLAGRFGGEVETFRGHGFILFTPWTTPEDVAENIRAVRGHAPFLSGSIGLASRLCFYDPFNPIYRLAELEGLTVSSPNDYGLDFRFADRRTELMCRLALAVEGTLVQRGAAPGPPLSRAVLSAVVPLFTGTEAGSPETMFHEAADRARENLRRDGELWPSLSRAQGADGRPRS